MLELNQNRLILMVVLSDQVDEVLLGENLGLVGCKETLFLHLQLHQTNIQECRWCFLQVL